MPRVQVYIYADKKNILCHNDTFGTEVDIPLARMTLR